MRVEGSNFKSEDINSCDELAVLIQELVSFW